MTAEVFMASIETVTSVKKQTVNKDTGKKTTVKACPAAFALAES